MRLGAFGMRVWNASGVRPGCVWGVWGAGASCHLDLTGWMQTGFGDATTANMSCHKLITRQWYKLFPLPPLVSGAFGMKVTSSSPCLSSLEARDESGLGGYGGGSLSAEESTQGGMESLRA